MITLCTVAPEEYDGYMESMVESLKQHTSLITNVLIAQGCGPYPQTWRNEPKTVVSEWDDRGIHFKKFKSPINHGEFGHSIGLHDCIDMVETDYIFFCDPDVVFLSAVDEFYMKLMTKYDLDYIGCSHHSAVCRVESFFPYPMNSLVRKDKLPPKSWKKDKLFFRPGCIMIEQLEGRPTDEVLESAEGKWLVSGPIVGEYHKLPNVKPTVLHDACNVFCLWGIEQNWKWLSFQTHDSHVYTTKYFKTQNINAKTIERLPIQKLIYHDVRQGAESLKNAWTKLREEE